MSRHSFNATHIPIRVIVALLSVALFGGMLPAGAPTTLSASAQFKLDAPEKVKLGQPIEIGLSVAGASNVGGYEALLRFDRGAAEFGGVRGIAAMTSRPRVAGSPRWAPWRWIRALLSASIHARSPTVPGRPVVGPARVHREESSWAPPP